MLKVYNKSNMLKIVEEMPKEGRFVAVTEVNGTSVPYVLSVPLWINNGKLLCQSDEGWIPADEEYHVAKFIHFVVSDC